jgi:hypothetical protein
LGAELFQDGAGFSRAGGPGEEAHRPHCNAEREFRDQESEFKIAASGGVAQAWGKELGHR